MRFQKNGGLLRSAAAPLALFLLLMIFLYFGASSVARSSGGETAHILEDAVRRCVVQCYAAEGMYPPSIEYLTEHYGLIVDNENYAVLYEAYGSNMFPNITVISLND